MPLPEPFYPTQDQTVGLHTLSALDAESSDFAQCARGAHTKWEKALLMGVYSADGYLFTLGSSYPQADQQVRPHTAVLHLPLSMMPWHESFHATHLLVTSVCAEAMPMEGFHQAVVHVSIVYTSRLD